MKTFILFWDTNVSEYSVEDFQEDIDSYDYYDTPWKVWEHDEASCGDRFFVVRLGEEKTGICMSGYFSSDPFKYDYDDDDNEEEVFCMKVDPEVMLNPDYCPLLSIEKLSRAIPEFDWTGGKSGRQLDEKQARKLESIWKKHLNANEEMFMTRAIYQPGYPSYYHSKNDPVQKIKLFFTKEGRIEAECETFGIEADGDDVESVVKQIADKVYAEYGKKPEFKTSLAQVNKCDEGLLRKAIDVVLEMKKTGMVFEEPGWHIDRTVIGYLDTVGATPEYLEEKGFPKKIINAVDALRRKPDEEFLKYLKRAAKNKIAREILLKRVCYSFDIKDKKYIDEATLEKLNEVLAAYHILHK
jgi:hypothetical protein